jgi:arylsulfatase A-like enzyme
MGSKKNIVLILIDDMGWRDIGCYGSTFYDTPNLDRLAREGMLFTDAYAACPVCSPSRASIMSGKYPASVGVTDWIDHGTFHPLKGRLIEAPYVKQLPLSEKSVASALKDGGYHTWHVGKWHLGKRPYYPEDHGFEKNIGGCWWGHPNNGYFSPWGIETLKDGPEGEYLTDRLTDEAIGLIENNDGKPFFLNMWYYAVHTPIQAKKEDILKYEQKAKRLGLDKLDPMEYGEDFKTEDKKGRRVTRRIIQSDPVYAAMVYNLDWNIGRLLEALDKCGQTDDTVVIFTSDNGGLSTAEGSPTCNRPLAEGKGWMYEGGVREPLLIKWPGVVKPGSVCREAVTSPDFYPTFLDIAGLPAMPEQHTDGVSMLPLLRGADKLALRPIFWHYPHYGNQGGEPASSVRFGDYKLIEFFEDGRLELYNLRDDLEEKYDLASVMPGKAQELRKMLDGWRRSIDAKIPQKNPDYKPNV